MPVVEETTVELSHKGRVTDTDGGYATEKITAVADTCRERVTHVEIRLVFESEVDRERPAQAETTLHIDGRRVRAHVAASAMTEAIDLLVDRLNRRVRRHEERRHRLDSRHRTGQSEEHEWRHGDLPTHRPEYLDRVRDEREIVRRKTFAWGPMSLDEAAFELDHLAHDFYLFEHVLTGRDAVLTHGDDGRLELLHPDTKSVDLGQTVAPIDLSPIAVPSLADADAREALDASGSRWLFYVDAETNRGRVLYLRYDGHYGVILPA